MLRSDNCYQKLTLRNFLVHSKGIITKDTVQQYLDSNESTSWKSNQIKAPRKYTRDHLKLGSWIEIPKTAYLPLFIVIEISDYF